MFTGQRLDAETGLMYYKNRHLTTDLGRFLSRDREGYSQGFSLYAYVAGRPTQWVDESGLIKGKGKYKDCYKVSEECGFQYSLWGEVRVCPEFWWEGGNDSKFSRDIAQANDILEQCCIKVYATTRTYHSPRRTIEVLGANQKLDASKEGDPPNAEETALKKEAELNTDCVPVHYLKGINTNPPPARGVVAGLAYNEAGSSYMIALGNEASGRSLAHELGHFLGRLPHPPDPFTDTKNVMGYGGGTDLSDEECDKIRKHKLIRFTPAK